MNEFLSADSFPTFLNVSSDQTVAPRDQDVIDQALQITVDKYREISVQLGVPVITPSIETLRESSLGRNLTYLSAVGKGIEDSSATDVKKRVNRVLALFLDPIATDDYDVPIWFWRTSLGRILASAIARTYPASDLIHLACAAERLEVDRETVDNWAKNGTIEAIFDETGALRVSLRAIERMRTVARELEPSQPSEPHTSPAPEDKLIAEHDYGFTAPAEDEQSI